MPEVVLSRTLMTVSTYPVKLHFCRDQHDDVGHNVLGCRAAILWTSICIYSKIYGPSRLKNTGVQTYQKPSDMNTWSWSWSWCTLLLTSISAIRWQDPILGIASVDKGGAPNVLGTARDLSLKNFLTISCSKLFQLMVVLGEKRISVDSRFCRSYSITLRVVSRMVCHYICCFKVHWVPRFDQSFGIYSTVSKTHLQGLPTDYLSPKSLLFSSILKRLQSEVSQHVGDTSRGVVFVIWWMKQAACLWMFSSFSMFFCWYGSQTTTLYIF